MAQARDLNRIQPSLATLSYSISCLVSRRCNMYELRELLISTPHPNVGSLVAPVPVMAPPGTIRIQEIDGAYHSQDKS